MQLKTLTRAISVAALLGATALTTSAAAQEQKTITGGFDVGPGGFQGNFNPLAATGGFTWLNVYFEPLVNYNADLTAIEGALANEYPSTPTRPSIPSSSPTRPGTTASPSPPRT